MSMQPYDFNQWQQEMGYSNAQAAHALDVSVSFLAKLKRDGEARPLYIWAAYGLQRYKQDQVV